MPIDINLYQDKRYLNKLHAVEEDVHALVSHAAQPFIPEKRPRISAEALEKAYKSRMHKQQRRAKILAWSGIGLWIVSLGIFAFGVMPTVAYGLFPDATSKIAAAIGETADIEKSGFGEEIYETEAPKPEYVPPFDPTLPLENRIIIESIGLDAVIGEGDDWEEVLKDGVWRAPDFGDPENRQLPSVLAAHRFGYIYWTNQYRRENSFYNLPKLEEGAQIEVIWNQRKYLYEIFEGYTGAKILDLDADLILFTCQVLNSDQRIIRKARLVEPESFQNYLDGGELLEN